MTYQTLTWRTEGTQSSRVATQGMSGVVRNNASKVYTIEYILCGESERLRSGGMGKQHKNRLSFFCI